MRRLPKPDLDAREVFDACVGQIPNLELLARFVSVVGNLSALANDYEARTVESELHLYPASEWGKGEQKVLGDLTKSQFTDLYSTYMVPATRPARIYYDKILNSVPLEKCPLCGFGQVSTLDHFMCKAHYPYFAVLPINLVPVCADCNKKKASSKLKENSQSSHPYFEAEEIETETWLYANVVESSPAIASFSVVPPQHWPRKLRLRIENHFHDLELASRFAIEAASEMTTLSELLGLIGAHVRIGEYLHMIAQTERMQSRNTWKAALYEALSQSAWYQSGGYKGYHRPYV